jgi:hypothetical protein
LKWFVYIFSCYLLAITCLPCADENDCTEVTTKQSFSKENHDHEQEKACSPFCHCACCQTVSFTKNIDIVVIVPVKETIAVTAFANEPLQDNFSSIWQPPKIG